MYGLVCLRTPVYSIVYNNNCGSSSLHFFFLRQRFSFFAPWPSYGCRWKTFVSVVIHSLNCVRPFSTLWIAARKAPQSFTVSWSLLKFMSIELVMLYNHLNLCNPLLILPSVLPSIRYFLMSWLFASSGQSIGASSSALALPMSIQGWFPLGSTGLISLQSKGLSRVLFTLR